MWATRHGNLPEQIVKTLAASPDGSTLLVGLWSQGIFRSTDGGATWTAAPGTTGDVRSMVHCLADPTRVWAVSEGSSDPGGVFRSMDSGATWAPVSAMPVSGAAYHTGLVVDGADCNVAWVSSNDGVHVTSDGGANWTPANTGLPEVFLANRVTSLARSPTAPQTFYAGVEVEGSFGTTPGAFCITTDGGSSWQVAVNNLASPPKTIAVSPSNPNTINIQGDETLHVSTDGGWTFTALAPEPGAFLVNFNGIAVNPHDETEVFMAGLEGIYRSSNSGGSWMMDFDPMPRANGSSAVSFIGFIPRAAGPRLAIAGSLGVAIRD